MPQVSGATTESLEKEGDGTDARRTQRTEEAGTRRRSPGIRGGLRALAAGIMVAAAATLLTACGDDDNGTTATPPAAPTNTPIAAPTNTPTAAPTNTPTAVPTSTPTATRTSTPTTTPTPTPTPTATPSSTATATATPTPTNPSFVETDLVSDVPGRAAHTDPNLVNPWGIALSPTGPFWISDNHAGVSTLYDGSGTPLPLVVTIPPPDGSPAGTLSSPTGQIFNATSDFVISAGGKSAPALFIFSSEDGTLSGWNTTVDATHAIMTVDRSSAGALYKGLAIGSTSAGNFLYATNFAQGTIDVFDKDFAPASLAGNFTDATIPAGFAPFGIHNIGGQLYVTYAQQDADKHDDVPGPGNGYVNVFDTSGTLVRRFATQGTLNSPWGLALGPASFGTFAGTVLIGNFGDGRISAFDATSGKFRAQLSDATGTPIMIPGLWGLIVGNNGRGGDSDTLYFTAGPDSEAHGLFGALRPPTTTFIETDLVSDVPGRAAHTDPNLVNPWGIALSPTGPFWISDNHAGVSTLYDGSGTALPLVVTIPPPDGSPAGTLSSPTGQVFNATSDFVISAGGKSAPALFIFSSEDGTLSGWNTSVDATHAIMTVDRSSAGAIYKGLAIGSTGAGNFLYATNFAQGTIDAFDKDFAPATLAGSFSDPNIPAGFAPFGIQNIGGKLYVTYAQQDENKEDDVPGPGNGYVNVFDTSGTLVRRFATQGTLNSPWGLAMAPASFGTFAGTVLIGNFGDGHISAFDAASGKFRDQLSDPTATPITIPGLWGLIVGNNGRGGNSSTLYFSAGPDGETHGLFGALRPPLD